MKPLKRFLSLAVCLVMVLSFAGCQEETAYVPTGNALAGEDDRVTTPQTDPQAAEQELTLVYYPDQSLNPYQASEQTNRTLFSLIYQGLFTVDRNYEAHPMLCQRYAVSQDMRSYVFYLAEDATFSDGTRLTARDVVASLQAARKSPVYEGRFYHFNSISETTDGGILIELDTAYENLPILLDIPIVKAAEVDAERPLGTGPYYLESITGGPRLRRRNNWWCGSTTLAVTASSITLREAGTNAQIRDAFQFEDVGLVCANPGSDSYADYRCDYELWDCESGIFLYLGCNLGSKVFSNSKVRAALTYAIDRDTLVEEYYHGFARSATLPASPQSPYYNNSLASRYGYDAVRFHDALSDAGLLGESIVFLVNEDDSFRVRQARAIKQMLEDCGLEVTLLLWGGNNYLYALAIGNFDLYLGQTKLSPNMDLSQFFASGGALNYGGLTSANMYSLCLQSLANEGNYYNLHETIMEDGRICPILFHSYAVYATRGLLTGLTPSRDNVFCYTRALTMEQALVEMPTVTTVPETTGEPDTP